MLAQGSKHLNPKPKQLPNLKTGVLGAGYPAAFLKPGSLSQAPLHGLLCHFPGFHRLQCDQAWFQRGLRLCAKEDESHPIPWSRTDRFFDFHEVLHRSP